METEPGLDVIVKMCFFSVLSCWFTPAFVVCSFPKFPRDDYDLMTVCICRRMKEYSMFSNIYVELYHCTSIPGVRSSAVHNTGLVVLIRTTGSSGSRWLDVDNNPSNEDSCSARWDKFRGHIL